MKNIIQTIAIILIAANFSLINAQASYYNPTHYSGIFYGQPSSARATGMGLTTITLDGVENVFYNPATIGLTKEKVNVHLNYALGSPVYKGSQYPFLGISYRINDKLIVSASNLNWWDEKNSPWTTIIGGFEESVERRSQSVYLLTGNYEIIPGLNFGVSGNYLVSRSLDDNVTNSEFILSVGAIYTKEVDFIKSDNLSNQRLVFAGSLVNALMKNRIEQTYLDNLNYRDLPIHLSFGAAYKTTLAIRPDFTEGKGFFSGAPKTLDLAIHLQYRDVLPGPKETIQNINHENNTAFGIGAEAWFMNLLALRLGYYNETRPTGDKPDGGFWATGRKKGLTWGFGVNLPVNRLTNGKLPFNSEVNFVTSRILDDYADNFTPPSYFTDRTFLFSVGINLKFVDKN
ncbi:hypothetical protein EYD45_07730 [Hyunsoonleella flava]|uniref:Long-chain fatty acid transport protein n=1 Tax=Hyunsoonleella flava TaxID=2527939 RepID=A0A4Q9FJ48_9FLAO|nr:hypothetical protein [Hyunsoonleella flava]TBN03904.1 hypothetical protein EYD45_07730 [Hyunsoonleella flava]